MDAVYKHVLRFWYTVKDENRVFGACTWGSPMTLTHVANRNRVFTINSLQYCVDSIETHQKNKKTKDNFVWTRAVGRSWSVDEVSVNAYGVLTDTFGVLIGFDVNTIFTLGNNVIVSMPISLFFFIFAPSCPQENIYIIQFNLLKPPNWIEGQRRKQNSPQ